MKNLTKLSLLTASLIFTGAASAVDDVNSGDGSVKVTGHVPVNCTVDVAEGTIDMEHNPVLGQRFDFDGAITFTCNNKKGANITVTAGGGLANEASPDHVIDYSAWLEIIGQSEPLMGGIGGNFVELVCKDSTCDSNTVMTGEKDMMLAMGAVTGKLSVALTEDIKFAGVYNDDITISISAKI